MNPSSKENLKNRPACVAAGFYPAGFCHGEAKISEPSPIRSVAHSDKQRGATLLEFALVAGALLLLMFVIIDFGRAAYVYHFVSVASAQGARYGAVRGATYSGTSCSSSQIYLCDATLSDIQTYVSNQVSSGIYVNSGASSGQPGYLNTTVTWPGVSSANTGGSPRPCVKLASAANSPGCAVQVTVTYTYGFTLPLLKFTNITMTSSSEMDISQ